MPNSFKGLSNRLQLISIFCLSILIWHTAGSIYSPARPPAIPLAVRSPYMNTWLEVGSSGNVLPGSWPRFWAGSSMGPSGKPSGDVTAWTGIIRVDGESYIWMGEPVSGGKVAEQYYFEYTSTRSTFILHVAQKISMNVTFLSPVNPTDYKRQSIIGTYLEVAVVSNDGAEHSVQLYADISAEWVNPMNPRTSVEWSFDNKDGVASHKVHQRVPVEYNADYDDDGAHWGNWYWSTAASNSLTYQSGDDQNVRGTFLDTGVLLNSIDPDYRSINSKWPVFAFANDLSKVGVKPITTLFTIIHAQKNGVYFSGRDGLAGVPSLWGSYFNSEEEMVNFFYMDRESENGALDQKILTDSVATGGNDYLIITSLSVRQTFAGIQLFGTAEKPYLFLKEISSNGNCQTVDVIFPSIPIFLYLNPNLLKLLLEPLYEHQEAGHYPNAYSMHDLGARYPQAIGHPKGDDQKMPIEECGNMIIMSLSYAQRANDTQYLKAHYPILRKWVDFLVKNTLIPSNQESTDDFQGALSNQTNLALKGIIAIEAMSVISGLTGHEDDRLNFTNLAHDYIRKWQDLAIVHDKVSHTNLAYGDNNTYGLLYNLYNDRLLNLKLVPQGVYDMQSEFYPTVVHEFGVQLDTRNLATKSDWEIWVAAISSSSTQKMFISKMAKWINATSTNRALTDLYNAQTGDYWSGPFIARPVVGGHFALLALDEASTTASRTVQ